eukprot:4119839-Pyramimonas_sp.AAC.1
MRSQLAPMMLARVIHVAEPPEALSESSLLCVRSVWQRASVWPCFRASVSRVLSGRLGTCEASSLL